MTKYVFNFGAGKADGEAAQKNLLGGKGANLAEMTNIGIPVPPGFTLSTELCTWYNQNNGQFPDSLEAEVSSALIFIEQIIGQGFGDPNDPLLVSVRSGAPVSMPGMMDTILNLGLNDQSVLGLAKKSGNERFAWDSYRRFLQMYANVVMGLSSHLLEKPLEDIKEARGVRNDTDLNADDLREVAEKLKENIARETGAVFPQDPREQLWGAIKAVFDSWNNERAFYYRRMHEIPDSLGTAVNVQSMVFGNMGDDCATGVCFTRNPSTGEKIFFGEFLVNAQGEDVVAGIRTPQQITRVGSEEWAQAHNISESDRATQYPSLEELMPEAFVELVAAKDKLEQHYRDMQDIEFTIQQGSLYLLQTRNGKRTGQAAVRIAVEMVKEGSIDEKTAISRVEPAALDQLLHPMISPADRPAKALTRGLAASPGAASGRIVLTSEDAVAAVEQGIKTVLVRLETSPEDIAGMNSSEGILTGRGGMTSHAAVVARGMGKPCVCGAQAIEFHPDETLTIDGHTLRAGDPITIDGSTGEVFPGLLPTVEPELSDHFNQLMSWADQTRKLEVRTNADTPHDAEVARNFGAQGIGLCRTEHMFFEHDRITAVRRMILSRDDQERLKALNILEPIQEEDFYGILKAMDGLPVTIRLLDPPLHEFLPHTSEEIDELAAAMGISSEIIRQRNEALKEFNPMLGHRGCRLAVTFPDIYRMQVRAIYRAAARLEKEGANPIAETMIPIVGALGELKLLRDDLELIACETLKGLDSSLPVLIGTMIELPRAAITADEIATSADFFSFGTNDLTQTTLGMSRDDAAKFLGEYVDKGIYDRDPFVSIDEAGVGALVQIAVQKGRSAKPNMKMGICGEHGGDPRSIHFCQKVGLDYVSCSPYRVPIARLAAAQAAMD